MHQDIDADLLLESNAPLRLLFDKSVIRLLIDLPVLERRTCLADLRRLRK